MKIQVAGVYTTDITGRAQPVECLFVVDSIIVAPAHPDQCEKELNWVSPNIKHGEFS